MGVKTSPAASDGSLFYKKDGLKTTVMAITVDNFNINLSRSEILNRICKAIDQYTYFGIIIKDNANGGASWYAGNVGAQEFNRVMHTHETKIELKSELKTDSKTEKTEKTDTLPHLDLKKVTKIIKATVNMSDVLFDDISQADRKLLARELEKLGEDPSASLLTVPKV